MTRSVFLLVSIIMIISVVSAAEIGEEVFAPSNCSTGYARFVSNANESGGKLYCVDSYSATQWAYPLDEVQNTSANIFANPISASEIKVQLSLALTNTVWSDAQTLYWVAIFDGLPAIKVLGIKSYIAIVWAYIKAFFILVLETIKLLFYIVELLVVFYIMFTLVPETFFKLRDAIADSYLKRYAR